MAAQAEDATVDYPAMTGRSSAGPDVLLTQQQTRATGRAE